MFIATLTDVFEHFVLIMRVGQKNKKKKKKKKKRERERERGTNGRERN